MKLLAFCFLFSLSSLNVINADEISKIYLYNVNYISEISSELKCIKVDSTDIQQINLILDKIKYKKNPIYKPAANCLYGKCEIKGKLWDVRLTTSSIIIKKDKTRHFILKDKEDIEWMIKFLEKYNKEITEFCQ